MVEVELCYGDVILRLVPILFLTQNMDRFLLDLLKNTMLPYLEDNLPLRWVFQHAC